jgi:hypothetical protein
MIEPYPKWWQFWKVKPQYRDSFPTNWTGKKPIPDGPGTWRFSRFDGRFVYDYENGDKGFRSPTWYDVDPFAEYVNELEKECERQHLLAEHLYATIESWKAVQEPMP